MSSPAGNYYKFVYEDDDDSGDDNDNELPPISPVVDEPEMYECNIITLLYDKRNDSMRFVVY